MENEGNSLLELPLETVEILEEVQIPSDHVGTEADAHEDNVGEMLIDEGTQSGLSGMETNSIDFEFVNTELGTGTDFNIDNTSVFGMTDNGIDVREDCEYLFREDSTCFDDSNTCVNKQTDVGSLTHSSMVSIPNTGKLNLYKDLGLKLQVIPLDNLQYVSTIQTSKGLHILAIPSQVSLPSNCDDVTIQQLCQKSKPNSSDISGNQCLESRIQTISKSPHIKGEISENLTKVNAKNIKSNRGSVNSSLLSKTTRNLKNSVNKKLIICRNNTLKKGCVQSILNKSNVISQRSDKKDGLGFIKSNYIRKRKMVSILNKSMTNRQEEQQHMGDSKEIKVTFHLKPTLSGENMKVADDICSKSSSKIMEPKSNENQEDFEIEKQRTFDRGEDIDDDKQMNPIKISDNEKIVPNRNAVSKHVNIVEKNPESDQNEVRETVVVASIEDNPVLDRTGQTQSLNEIHNKVLNTETIFTESKTVEKGFQCKTCLTTFSRQGHFKNHLKTHLDILTEPKSKVGSSTDNYKFDSKQFPEVNTVKKQVSRCSDLLVPNGCSDGVVPNGCSDGVVPSGCSDDVVEKELYQSSSVDSEKKSAISSKLFTCEFCEMSFKTPGNLTRHKLTHNVNEDRKVKGRFQCDDCNRSFMQKCDLKRHVITHTGTFPFTCTVCDKGFIRQSDLNVHEKFHTQEKQYRCGLCSKSYFQTGDLSRHMRKSHGDMCQFTCRYCNKKYTTQKTLTIHMKTKH